MAFNLFSLLESEFTSDVSAKIASFVGESPAKTQTALTQAVPAVMCALHQKAATPTGTSELFEMFQRGGFDGKTMGTPASVAGAAGGLADLLKVGGPLVASLFGSRHSGVVDWLANAAGIGKTGASSLLGLAVPFVLNLIGRQAGSTSGFNAASIVGLIKGQGSALGSAAPRGLAQALGVNQCGEGAAARGYAAVAPAGMAAADTDGGLLRWLLPVLGMLLLGILTVWWYAHQAPPATPAGAATTPRAVTATTPALAPATAPATATLVKQVICAGRAIEVGPNGVESKLIAFLDDQTSVIGPDTRFSFDRLEFETDQAGLKPSSRAQLKNIADIMECYPTVELKIAGHTDSTADDAYNLKLSQDRADSAKAQLVALGVASSRLGAEGYGEGFPIDTNDTEEGRQRNRRTDIIIMKK